MNLRYAERVCFLIDVEGKGFTIVLSPRATCW
jgi:hypothetical protein